MTVERDFYLKQLVDSMWNGQVKVITGLRRCGKSYLLKNRFFDDFGVLNISLIDFLQDSTGAI